MAANSQQFGTRQDVGVRRVTEINTPSIEKKLSQLTSAICQLVARNIQKQMVCEICTNVGHSMDMCPILHDENNEQVNMVGNASVSQFHFHYL